MHHVPSRALREEVRAFLDQDQTLVDRNVIFHRLGAVREGRPGLRCPIGLRGAVQVRLTSFQFRRSEFAPGFVRMRRTSQKQPITDKYTPKRLLISTVDLRERSAVK